MPSCVFVSFSNRSWKPPGVSLYQFAKDTELHKRWTAAVHCENLAPNYRESAYECSAHFQNSDFERDMLAELMNVPRPTKLKIGTVPTVFPHKPPPAKRKIKHNWSTWQHTAKLKMRDKATIINLPVFDAFRCGHWTLCHVII